MEKSFGEQLKQIREEVGLSQRKVAEQMLIPARTYEKWETGVRTPAPYVQRFVLNELEQLKSK